MSEVYQGTIEGDGAARPIRVTVVRGAEGERILRTDIAGPDGTRGGPPAPSAAAALSVAVWRFLAEQEAPADGARPRRRATPWTVGGRLDALGVDGFHRARVEARKRPMQTFQVTIDGRAYEVSVEEIRPAAAPAPLRPSRGTKKVSARGGSERVVRAPMPGKILAVNAGPQESVAPGAVLLVLEAMKMENDILAPGEGTVKAVHVRTGDTVNTGDVMVVIE